MAELVHTALCSASKFSPTVCLGLEGDWTSMRGFRFVSLPLHACTQYVELARKREPEEPNEVDNRRTTSFRPNFFKSLHGSCLFGASAKGAGS